MVLRINKIQLDNIVDVVAEHFRISQNDIFSKKITWDIVYSRRVVMYLLKRIAKCSITDICYLFKKEPEAVLSGIDTITDIINTNESRKNEIELLIGKIEKNSLERMIIWQ